jgi:serine/threonine-protein kinase HipA
LLSKNLTDLHDFPFTANEQIRLAEDMALKLSIQGVQPKLSVKLNVHKSIFEVVDKMGTFILKPPHHLYEEVPQNEDLSMKLAKQVGINTPISGLIYNIDDSLTYFIKRFDRGPKKTKYPVEDFAQLMSLDRDTKYNSSIEKLINLINDFCTFPIIEKGKFFRNIVFNYLIGNEDMHLKNYSLITINDITQLSPAYDLLNTSIVLKASEEISLSLNGKKSNLKRQDFIDYLAKKRLGLSTQEIDECMTICYEVMPSWQETISSSFLSENKKIQYEALVLKRRAILFA